jgi:hypothetical protein
MRHRYCLSRLRRAGLAGAADDQVFDLSDPAHPKKIRDFGLPGQQPAASGPVPTMLHGKISLGPSASRIYFADGLLQIVDRERLVNGAGEPTDDNLRYPEVGRFELSPLNGAHTTFPLLGMPAFGGT